MSGIKDCYGEGACRNEVLIEDLQEEVDACHALLDGRGYAIGSEFHGDLRRRVEWLTDSCRMGPKLKLENARLLELLEEIKEQYDSMPHTLDPLPDLDVSIDQRIGALVTRYIARCHQVEDIRAALEADE